MLYYKKFQYTCYEGAYTMNVTRIAKIAILVQTLAIIGLIVLIIIRLGAG